MNKEKKMKKQIGKKGVSALIATVLLVLITIVGVGIIFGVVIPMIQESMLTARLCGPDTYLEIVTEQGYTCFNSSANLTFVQIDKKFPHDLAKIVIRISGGGKTLPFEVPGSAEVSIYGEEGVRLLVTGESLTYEVNLTQKDMTTPQFVEVFPTIKEGEKIVKCEKNIAKVQLSPCAF